MIEKTKLTLSAKELELVCNTEWILTKHVIINKVYQLFGELALEMKAHLEKDRVVLPPDIMSINAKISRGENYRGLPYVMLDYPRNFSKDATLSIRTLFWWGNFFSINLQLSGIFKENVVANFITNYAYLARHQYWVCVQADPWQHHFEGDNYVEISQVTAARFALILNREPFLKIAKKISLVEWDTVPTFIEDHFKEMVLMLSTNFRGDETSLSPGIPTTGFGL